MDVYVNFKSYVVDKNNSRFITVGDVFRKRMIGFSTYTFWCNAEALDHGFSIRVSYGNGEIFDGIELGKNMTKENIEDLIVKGFKEIFTNKAQK